MTKPAGYRPPCSAAELCERYEAGERYFAEAPLASADLSGKLLLHCDLTGIDLTGAKLHGTVLQGCNLQHAQLVGADLTRANLNHGVLVAADLTRACLQSASFDGIEASEARMLEIDASPADLTEESFEHDSFTPTSFERAELVRANLSHARLDWCWFEAADLLGADLSHTRLWGTKFLRACIKDACLRATESEPRLDESVLNYRTYVRSALDSAALARWRAAGAIIEDFENFPFEVLRAAADAVASAAASRLDPSVGTLLQKGHVFDVALSFAGEDRAFAKALADELVHRGLHVFFDERLQEELWGKNLVDVLQEVYSRQSKFCLMLVSKHYVSKNWTRHERAAAQARAFESVQEYILPIVIDEVDVPGMNKTVGWVHAREGVQHICDLIVKKVRRYHATQDD